MTGLTYLPVTVSSSVLALLLRTLLISSQKIGSFFGCFSYIYYWNPRYLRHVAAFAPNPVPPEYRLEMAVWATVPYAAAFFWFG